MPRPPENWVTEALAEARRGRIEAPTGEWPEVPGPLLAFLEAVFMPRCYEGQETIENHLLHAGKVQLVEAMREAYDRQQTDGVEMVGDA